MAKNRSSFSAPAPGHAPWVPPRVGVCPAGPDRQLLTQAQAVAAELGLPLVNSDDPACDLVLVATTDGLELRETGPRAAGGVRVDFRTGPDARRLATASRRQPLAVAVGLKRHAPTVVDATAGLGRDAVFLSSLGCKVIAIERSAVLAAMMRDALKRAAGAPAMTRVRPERLSLLVGDARNVLLAMSEREAPDVVYLDPMYPPRGKSALPKKEMRILRRLVGDDPDADQLLEVARQVARSRVVVKRALRTPYMASRPAMSYRSKLVRYDVYQSGRPF